MKRLIFLALTLLLAGCATTPPADDSANPLLGGDRDEHGCIGSAGYQWCAPKQKCLRAWEEECFASAFEALTWELAARHGDEEQQITLTMTQQTDTFARASVRFGPPGTPGGLVLAAKTNGAWSILYEGNGSVDCDALKAASFPQDMLDGICD
ncbi:MAG: hypothetical protein PeribacterA2_0926 [Candidatus Peribacter riflensis]|uniref:Lipoprotein n=1 Tax=Candidatus Peribacter riflensis TaxID=1735162 RepID=A0A0S1SPV3_9BACT|nr:MAG: hypothetical protein PeribacterA2_0926 [Candidatus Peribacter riflensis]OGJ78521.1 MAG: hypothetical protein A2398_02670 [Candidatus Peribacteria bacterium RIFOXYB1_FULL_57_12]ALM11389.1 MAG: hypothetical protein PeribacterB2_0928 [Candidatus Peribacter riflensis]ALM12491.1 MAG: hypothetical protein PeribacterC2_0927 [Candidatus Peribacter riflensis]ALM13592.1 MAG: hypothetical protein PeribacterD1_0926 [Candidatus Peribacter riflensis]